MRLSRRRIAQYAAQQLADGHQAVLREVAAYLIATKRINEADLVAHDIEVALADHGHVLGRASAAHELVESTKAALLAFIKKATGAHDARLVVERDDSLLAGFKLDLPNRQLDASASRTLLPLKNKEPTMSELDIAALSKDLRASIEKLDTSKKLDEVGVVVRIGDGVAWIYGLRSAGYSEVLQIETDKGIVEAFVLNLMEDEVGAVLLGSDENVKAGDTVRLKGVVLEVPVGPELLGRVVNPLGKAIDGGPAIKTKHMGLVEREAIGVMGRKSVFEPLMTGIVAIDAMFPIGRGQRELIIGDRQIGKTAIAIDTMINQAKQKTGVINVYVAIGQKLSKVARLVERLKTEGVMEQTIVVVTSPADPASLLYLAPYAATAMGEYFRDNGQHALMIYDDLTKHAVAYRQMSLLLRRPPGREAFPGDVFYLHSRLLERSAKLSDELGGGSLTALPIIETQAGDISAYIPTNVISITDGQIFMETDLFYQGIRPAISAGLSVSRVGGAAQTPAVKSVSGGLKLGLSQYRELASFAQFGSDLDDETKHQIERGQRLTELLKQPQYAPLAVWQQTASIYAVNSGAMDKVPPANIKEAQAALLSKLWVDHKKDVDIIDRGAKPTEPQLALIEKVASQVAKGFEK